MHAPFQSSTFGATPITHWLATLPARSSARSFACSVGGGGHCNNGMLITFEVEP